MVLFGNGYTASSFKLLRLVRPFIFYLLVYETGDRIFSKSGKKIKIQIAGFYFCRWSKNMSTKNIIQTDNSVV